MKRLVWRLILSAVFFAAALITNIELIKIILFIISYLFAGYDVVLRAFRNILRGDVFDENFLMAVASLGVFAIGEAP